MEFSVRQKHLCQTASALLSWNRQMGELALPAEAETLSRPVPDVEAAE